MVNDATGQKSKNTLANLVDNVLFIPTASQRKVKTKFWSRFIPGPFDKPGEITKELAAERTGSASLNLWWSKPGFKEWFNNRDEPREKLEYLYMLALDTAEQVLNDQGERSINAKVQMIKVIAELGNKFPIRGVEKFADSEVNDMDEKQLKAFLERKGVKLVEETVINVRDDKKSSSEKQQQQEEKETETI